MALPIQTPQPIAEWIKILFTALVGMVTGVLSGLLLEPLKQQLSLKSTARRARKAIYREMSDIYHNTIRVAQVPASPQALLTMQTQVFDYYYERHREAFYEIPEWSTLLMLHGMITFISKHINAEDEMHVRSMATELKRHFDSVLASGCLEPAGQRLWTRIERTVARDKMQL